jgi:hypothetical protein
VRVPDGPRQDSSPLPSFLAQEGRVCGSLPAAGDEPCPHPHPITALVAGDPRGSGADGIWGLVSAGPVWHPL